MFQTRHRDTNYAYPGSQAALQDGHRTLHRSYSRFTEVHSPCRGHLCEERPGPPDRLPARHPAQGEACSCNDKETQTLHRTDPLPGPCQATFPKEPGGAARTCCEGPMRPMLCSSSCTFTFPHASCPSISFPSYTLPSTTILLLPSTSLPSSFPTSPLRLLILLSHQFI